MRSTITVSPSPQHCCTRCVRLSFQKLSPFTGFLGIVFPNLNYTPVSRDGILELAASSSISGRSRCYQGHGVVSMPLVASRSEIHRCSRAGALGWHVAIPEPWVCTALS